MKKNKRVKFAKITHYLARKYSGIRLMPGEVNATSHPSVIVGAFFDIDAVNILPSENIRFILNLGVGRGWAKKDLVQSRYYSRWVKDLNVDPLTSKYTALNISKEVIVTLNNKLKDGRNK